MVVVVVVVVVVGWGWGLRRADLFDHLDDALLGLHNGHLLDLHPLHHLLHRHLRRPARAAQVSPVRSFARKNARRGRQERARSRAASAIAATDSRGAFSAAPQTCFSEAPKTCRPDGARFLGRACSGPGLAPRWSANETGATPPFAPPRPGRSAPDRPRGAPRRSTAWVTAARPQCLLSGLRRSRICFQEAVGAHPLDDLHRLLDDALDRDVLIDLHDLRAPRGG